MINYVQAFVENEDRKPTPTELGKMMVLVAKRERERHGHLRHTHHNPERQNNIGGQKKKCLRLSDNALKINDLVIKGFDTKTIALILDLKQNTVASLIRKNAIPRKPEEIFQ